MIECIARALELFSAKRCDIVDQSCSKLYPQQRDFAATCHRVAPLIAKRAVLSDDPIMRRIDGTLF